MEIRVATPDDLERLTETLAGAFAADPLWSWAFPELDALALWWRFYVSSALRYPWVWIAGDFAAVASWIPPGGVELTEGEEAMIEGILDELVGPRAPQVLELLERFEQGHPTGRDHYYLSLLGTHPEHRGKGLGMALLAENLELIDEQGACAYLESSNPANDPRYERNGFRRIGSFDRPDGKLTVSRMWRDPAPSA
jgi:GNAT superfamily N-acetyltransferase